MGDKRAFGGGLGLSILRLEEGFGKDFRHFFTGFGSGFGALGLLGVRWNFRAESYRLIDWPDFNHCNASSQNPVGTMSLNNSFQTVWAPLQLRVPRFALRHASEIIFVLSQQLRILRRIWDSDSSGCNRQHPTKTPKRRPCHSQSAPGLAGC